MKYLSFIFISLLLLGVDHVRADDGDDQWSGNQIRFVFNPEQTTANITFSCADATIEQMKVESNGDFVGLGTYVQEHGGPIRIGETLHTYSANFAVIRTSPTTMALIMKVEGKDFPLPSIFYLTKGLNGRLFRCM